MTSPDIFEDWFKNKPTKPASAKKRLEGDVQMGISVPQNEAAPT